MPDLWKAIILGIIEGVTEFLPISSTGHLLLAERWMGGGDTAFWNMFAVFIQVGAIMAVVVYFRERIAGLLRAALGREDRPAAGSTAAEEPREPVGGNGGTATAVLEAPPPPTTAPARRHAIWMIVIGCLPLGLAAVADEWSEEHLFTTPVIAASLGIGGLLILLIERFRPTPRTDRMEAMTWKQALGIGLAQVLAAVFPGTSRSAATIMGGLVAGLTREAAAEFSFFLAIPAMFAACSYKLLKHVLKEPALSGEQWVLLAVGTVVSFLVAWVVIAGFMAYIRRHTFTVFAVYRIVLAGVVLWLVG